MDKLTQIGALLVQFFFYAYILIIVLRFLLQVVRADFYNPLSQFIVKVTNPILIPLRKIIPGLFGIDIASIVLAVILQMITLQLLFLLAGGGGIYPVLPLIFGSAIKLVGLVLNIYFYSFIILVVISWVAPQTQNPVISVVHSLTEPVLRPIRKFMPSMGGLDFSIMIGMLGILVIKILLGVN
jgi:YggT family protein